jgi:RNA polymerase sigma-70 factor (ECF subfamily)
VGRATGGDVDAFYSLIDRHDHALRGLAYRLLENPDAMDDALQESYLKAFRALPRFEGDSAFKSWLYRIVYNTCLDELRRRKVGVLPIESVSERPDGRPDPGDVATDKLDLAAAVGSLSPDTRAAVLLVYVDGMDYRTATEILGVSRGTLASRLHRARARLQRALDGSEGEERSHTREEKP